MPLLCQLPQLLYRLLLGPAAAADLSQDLASVGAPRTGTLHAQEARLCSRAACSNSKPADRSRLGAQRVESSATHAASPAAMRIAAAGTGTSPGMPRRRRSAPINSSFRFAVVARLAAAFPPACRDAAAGHAPCALAGSAAAPRLRLAQPVGCRIATVPCGGVAAHVRRRSATASYPGTPTPTPLCYERQGKKRRQRLDKCSCNGSLLREHVCATCVLW